MERQALETGSGCVSYLTGGDEQSGRPVVFVHGLTIEARTWLPIIERMGPRRWFALDLPGHGTSEWCNQYSFRNDAEALISLLTEIGEPVVTVGHSRGAQVCLLAAAICPDLFAAMYLEDLTPRFWWEARDRGLVFAASVFRLRGIAETARTEGRDATWLAARIGELKHDALTTFGERLTPANLKVWAEAALNFDSEMLGAKGVFGPPNQSATEIITSIEGPIHLAHGDEDHGSAVTGEELAWFAATAKQPSSTNFRGLGHFLHDIRPSEFTEDLRQFLARVG